MQIAGHVPGGTHTVLEAWLHGGSDSKHHKALKELSVHNLRQIQREVCLSCYVTDASGFSLVVTSRGMSRMKLCCTEWQQVLIPSRVRHPCIVPVEAVFVDDIHVYVCVLRCQSCKHDVT